MAAVSKVLEDEDLLTEILLRTVFPTTLLKTALVCTRWLTHASDRAFLRRFREIHPPRLLGFYINKASSFSIIELPEGMEYGERNTILSQADDVAGVYLIHVKKFQLRIWLHNGYTWLLMDTIYLRGICADLSMADGNTSLLINQAGDNAEFVFLDMGRCTFLLDIKCKTMHKVYEKEDGDNFFCEIHPLMMIWPPVFPTLKDDPTRSIHHQSSVVAE
ncbi:hypothetical protein D1007_06841 [Hordeum vulgare]|nr:hypothetical protein D1007_06841 [Hordeum vulgare]